MGIDGSLGAVNPAEDVVVTKTSLARIEAYHDILWVVEDTRKVVPAVSDKLAAAATSAIGPDWLCIQHPAGDVQGVYILLGYFLETKNPNKHTTNFIN